jgi:hypothetical protein
LLNRKIEKKNSCTFTLVSLELQRVTRRSEVDILKIVHMTVESDDKCFGFVSSSGQKILFAYLICAVYTHPENELEKLVIFAFDT